jgi:hypothetical protein
MTLDPAAVSPGDLNVAARLRPGVSLADLERELAAIAAALAREGSGSRDVGYLARPMREEFQRDPGRSIAALSAAVGFVLVIACVNLATLLLARSEARSHEMALRGALGAGRGRQVRQLLTESLVLAALGGTVGAALALAGTRWLSVLIPPRVAEVIQHVRVDAGALAVSACTCLLAAVLFGLAPALRASQLEPAAALRDGGRPGSARGRLMLDLLVVAEVALAAVLLAGAELTARNFVRLLSADVGYEAEGLLRINVGLPIAEPSGSSGRSELVRRVVESVGQVSGVVAAGATSLQPIPRTRTNVGTALLTDAARDTTEPPPNRQRASGDARLLRGGGRPRAAGAGVHRA